MYGVCVRQINFMLGKSKNIILDFEDAKDNTENTLA
jgi:hypothetical protein